jgi:hypothetical protein
MPRALEADPPETERLFEAGVRVKGSVVVVADCVTLRAAVLGVGVEPFRQLPSLLGRQLEHRFPAFAQAQQPLHEPVLLHLQHRAICTTFPTVKRENSGLWWLAASGECGEQHLSR